MASVNKVILVGNCGRDPEVRYLPSGQAVANISIATSSKRKDKTSGEKSQPGESISVHLCVAIRRRRAPSRLPAAS